MNISIGQIAAAVAIAVVTIGAISSYVLTGRDVEDHDRMLRGELGLVAAVEKLEDIHLAQKVEKATILRESQARSERNQRNCALGNRGGMPKSWCRSEGYPYGTDD